MAGDRNAGTAIGLLPAPRLEASGSDTLLGMMRLPEPIDWIDSPAPLASAAARWRAAPALGIDTEFVRERTFYPQLGLIQVSDGERCALVDPVALPDLEPLRQVLVDPAILKVAHSPSEDMEVLYHRFGAFPQPLFDTQVGAALAGRDPAMSYQRLVRDLLAVELEKGETRTDWLRRPLSDRQVEYAARDVEFLLPVHRALCEQLAPSGRLEWVLEESRRLQDPSRFLPPVESAYLRLGGAGGMDRRQLAVLRVLAAWRESQARERDLPRNFVLRESALVALARRQPVKPADLASIPDLAPKQLERLGETLLRLVREGRQVAPEDQPPRAARGARDERGRELVDRMQERVRLRAEELGLAAPVLASRRELKQLLVRAPGDGPPPALAGWRWEAIGADLEGLLAEARATGVLG
jgi:ribonuclease D